MILLSRRVSRSKVGVKGYCTSYVLYWWENLIINSKSRKKDRKNEMNAKKNGFIEQNYKKERAYRENKINMK